MNLKILDTGYVSNNTLSGQTAYGYTDRAGYTGSGVTAFDLDISSVSLNGTANIESKPIINTLSDSETSLVSVTNRVYRINGILDKEIKTTGWNKNNIIQFLRLERTKGIKLFYPSNTTDNPTKKRHLIEATGAENTGGNFSSASPSTDSGTVSSTTPYILGRVRNISINDSPSVSKWGFSFDFQVTG